MANTRLMVQYQDREGMVRAWGPGPINDPVGVHTIADEELGKYLAKHPSMTADDFSVHEFGFDHLAEEQALKAANKIGR